jgi:hypothetical protein
MPQRRDLLLAKEGANRVRLQVDDAMQAGIEHSRLFRSDRVDQLLARQDLARAPTVRTAAPCGRRNGCKVQESPRQDLSPNRARLSCRSRTFSALGDR